jgi:hypothetical protein
MLNIKESLVKYVFKPAQESGLDPASVRTRAC